MKRSLTLVLSSLLFVLVGCNNDSELEGKEVGMASFNPTISAEEMEDTDFNFSSNMLVFAFESSEEVTLKHNGNSYSGDYLFEDGNLSITLEDDSTSLEIDFIEFEESSEESISYTGKIESSELTEDGDGVSQLTNINNNLSFDETYMFIEE